MVDVTVFNMLSCEEGIKSSIKELAKQHRKMCYVTRCFSFSNSHSTTSVCELSANETRKDEKEDPLIMDEMPFLSLIPQEILSDYEESSVIQEVRKELESLEDQAGLNPESDSAPDLFLGDEI